MTERAEISGQLFSATLASTAPEYGVNFGFDLEQAVRSSTDRPRHGKTNPWTNDMVLACSDGGLNEERRLLISRLSGLEVDPSLRRELH